MVSLKEVERQLEAIGSNSKFWGRPEIVELQHILVPGEQINACLNGRYQGGFATFVATDQRLLLVDKKVFFLSVEDMRYDMIAEVDFSAQLMSGTMKVCTPTKNLSFTSYKPQILRKVANQIQQKVMEVRHQYSSDPAVIGSTNGFDQVPQGRPVAAAPIQPVAAQPSAISTAAIASTDPYAMMLDLGNQAVIGANSQNLPVPQRRNPYMNPPLMMRRRIGRFGSIGTPQT
ncbi:MAG: PH domain-containing protein [Candidatus Saccharibacteria bacterium]